MDVPPIDRQVRRNVGGAAEETEFGSIQWVVCAGDPEGVEQTVGLVVIDAGKGNVEHVHPNCDEILLVLEGEAEHTLGRQSTRLRANDLIVVPRGVPHRFLNVGSTPARAYVVFSSPDRQFVPTGS